MPVHFNLRRGRLGRYHFSMLDGTNRLTGDVLIDDATPADQRRVLALRKVRALAAMLENAVKDVTDGPDPLSSAVG